jgi:hypothetical protein
VKKFSNTKNILEECCGSEYTIVARGEAEK